MPVLDWRDRLVCSRCGGREVDMVVSGKCGGFAQAELCTISMAKSPAGQAGMCGIIAGSCCRLA